MNIKGQLFKSFTRKPVECVLTTERAESSHGLPVLVVDGVAHGPADLGEHFLRVDSGFVTVKQSDDDLQLVKQAGFNVEDHVARFYGMPPRWETYQPNRHEDDSPSP